MKEIEIKKLLQQTIHFAENEQKKWLSKYGKPDSSIAVVIDALKSVKEMLNQNWPLLEKQTSQLNIGVYAVKNLIPDFIELANKINELEYFLENPDRNEMELI